MSENVRKLGTTHEALATLPSTRLEVAQAVRNREQLARSAQDSARIVKKQIDQTGAPLAIELGVTKSGEKLSGQVQKIVGESGLLRVKVLVNDEPTASYAYAGLAFNNIDGTTANHVIEESPAASGPDVEALTGLSDVRTLAMGEGLSSGTAYRGGDTIRDNGAADFYAVATVLAVAAEQINQQDAIAA